MSKIYFNLEKENLAKGELIKIPIYLDTDFEEINAVEVKIKFSKNLSFRDYFDGKSIISHWIEKPHLIDNNIVFSGIIPGGINGKDLNLIDIVFEAKESGLAKLEIDQTSQVLLNDGKGTKADLKSSKLSLNILEKTFLQDKIYETINDKFPPEEFKIYLIKNPEIFNGKYYIVFNTKDKQSGIAYYEVAEVYNPLFTHPDFSKAEFQKAESPYVLKDQSLSSYILVKAIDRAGNSRIEILKPQKMISFDVLILFLLFLGIVIVVLYKIYKLLFKKISNNKI